MTIINKTDTSTVRWVKRNRSPALAMFVQDSLWVWSATSRGRPPDGGLALAVFHDGPSGPCCS